MLAVRLDKSTEGRLERLARETRRSKSHYVKEAVAEYLAEREDVLIALSRLEKGERPLTSEALSQAVNDGTPLKGDGLPGQPTASNVKGKAASALEAKPSEGGRRKRGRSTSGGRNSMSEFTAVTKKDGKWWIGWIEEVPGVNGQERTRAALIESLRVALSEALEWNRAEALAAAGKEYSEETIAV